MTSITVFTDPHLGRTMQAHTTVASRARLMDAIFQTTDNMLTGKIGYAVCLGDLFDKFQNPEAVIQQGLAVARKCDYIMAGNHDITNDKTKIGSLELLAHLGQEYTNDHLGTILLSGFGEARCYLHKVGDCDFVFVPHHTTDDLFQQSLDDVTKWAHERRITRSVKPKAYLCLHCNYDSGFAVDETALSLTRKQAKDLLDAGIDYILIGHDHHPREDFDGKVIILGNMHPTGFGDITPKRVLEIGGDGSHTFHEVWSPDGKYVQLDAEALIGGMPELVPEGVQFIEITGKLPPEHVMHMAKAIRGLWTCYEPLAIRNKAEIVKATGGDSVSYDFQSIDKVVMDDLKDAPDLLELFLSFWGRTLAGLGED